MSITALIKEVNNAPVIFNVDNLQDQQNLENLQAIKVPEAMANEVFGNNIRYADNTTCVITENQDNPAFPYNVNFDASKITAKPKRDTGTLSGIDMPGDKFIDITPDTNVNYKYIAPFNGYLTLHCDGKTADAYISLHVKNDKINKKLYTICHGLSGISDYVPAKKGDMITINYRDATFIGCRFVLAEGEI
ncbi:MAG: hypothetical protein K2I05_08975 [Mailhella sp.]|nr:hypothetical protein [Mailhella sp.]